MGRSLQHYALLGLLALGVGGCGSFQSPDGGPAHSMDLSNTPDIIPRWEPRSASGNSPTYTVLGHTYHVLASSKGFVQRGIASWYGTKFDGQKTASGEVYNMYAMTGAHKTLPIPCYVRVTNLDNGRSTIVRINDRGPFAPGRIIDLSYAAASKLGVVESGTAHVELRAIDVNNPHRTPPTRIATATPAHPHTEAVATPARPGKAPASGGLGGQIYLQVGAFISRENAEQLREQLNRQNVHPVQVQQSYTNNRQVYRVRVGPLASVPDADAMATRMNRLGYAKAKIVTD